jgi:hypothetical protein
VLPDMLCQVPCREMRQARDYVFEELQWMSAQGKAEQLQFMAELLLSEYSGGIGRQPAGFPDWAAKSRQISAGRVSSPAMESKQPDLMSSVAWAISGFTRTRKSCSER